MNENTPTGNKPLILARFTCEIDRGPYVGYTNGDTYTTAEAPVRTFETPLFDRETAEKILIDLSYNPHARRYNSDTDSFYVSGFGHDDVYTGKDYRVGKWQRGMWHEQTVHLYAIGGNDGGRYTWTKAPHLYAVESTKSPRLKSGYEVRMTTDDKGEALWYWNALNIGNGYKGRLRENGKIIARKV